MLAISENFQNKLRTVMILYNKNSSKRQTGKLCIEYGLYVSFFSSAVENPTTIIEK